jgi:hypothetical protein
VELSFLTEQGVESGLTARLYLRAATAGVVIKSASLQGREQCIDVIEAMPNVPADGAREARGFAPILGVRQALQQVRELSQHGNKWMARGKDHRRFPQLDQEPHRRCELDGDQKREVTERQGKIREREIVVSVTTRTELHRTMTVRQTMP